MYAKKWCHRTAVEPIGHDWNNNWLGLVSGGLHEKQLLKDLLDNYNVLERPVGNESEPLKLSFGLTLMQIIDVVSQTKKNLSL